jgi:hypothetical protein
LVPWWSLDEPPGELIKDSLASMSIAQPSRLHKRRYPNVHLTFAQLKQIRKQLGKLNPDNFADEDPEVWLFRDMRTRFLYGSMDQNQIVDGNWEVTFLFLGDPIRKHELWNVKLVKKEKVRPISIADLPNAHERYRVYPVATMGFNDFIPFDDNCNPSPENSS